MYKRQVLAATPVALNVRVVVRCDRPVCAVALTFTVTFPDPCVGLTVHHAAFAIVLSFLGYYVIIQSVFDKTSICSSFSGVCGKKIVLVGTSTYGSAS